MQQGYLSLPTIGADLSADPTPLTWPLGRHDAQTWVINADLLMFSGAMDIYVRAPAGATCESGGCMVKHPYRKHIRPCYCKHLFCQQSVHRLSPF
jgi:hypothetical protein